MKPMFLALLIGMNLLWAGSYSIFKVLGQHLESGAIATIRFGLAAFCLAALWPLLPGKAPERRDFLRVFWLGIIVFCLAPRLQVYAVHLGQAGDTSLLMAIDPFIAAVAGALFLHEKVPARRWWGCLLGMSGVVLLSRVWQGESPLKGLVPNALFILSLFCETCYSVLGKPMLHRVGALKLLASGLVVGTALNVFVESQSGGNKALRALSTIAPSDWFWLSYLALVCTVIGYGLWYLVIRESEVNVAGMTVLIQPMAGWLLSVLWLKERLHFGQLWGALAILGGLLIALWRSPSRGVGKVVPDPAMAQEIPLKQECP